MFSKTFSKNGNISIFVHWSKNNELDCDTLNYLKELKLVSEIVLFVSNSRLAEKEKRRLEELAVCFIQRENRGYDFWGWREGIFTLKERLKTAQNLILCNSSCFLAFNTISNVLTKMDDKADLWGITAFKNKTTPYHLQSYFLVFKKSLLSQWSDFITFWEELPELETWSAAVTLGELRLTNNYNKLGYECRPLIDPCTLPSEDVNPSVFYAEELLKLGSPLLKKKIFTEDYSLLLSASRGLVASASISFIKDNAGNYENIMRYLINCCSPSQLIERLHLTFFDIEKEITHKSYVNKTAVICFVYYEDMIPYMTKVLFRFSDCADLYIVSSKENVLLKYKDLLKDYPLEVEFRLQPNRGRNEAAYFLTCRDVWDRYQYICALHDKKSPSLTPQLLGLEFMRHCEQNLCSDKASINSIISIFESNDLLGLLIPPYPIFGSFIPGMYESMGRNFKELCSLNIKLFKGKLFSGNEIDVREAPYGGMFWARTKALRPLLDSSLRLTDFPEEPLSASDGTFLHALERCYPLVCRQTYHYTARITSPSLLSNQFDNLLFLNLKLGVLKKLQLILKIIVKKKLSRHPLLYDLTRKVYNSIFR